MRLNWSKDLYIKGRIGWKGLSKDEYLTTGEYRIINATALMDGYIDWNNCGYISKERYYESEEIMLQNGDILISKDGTLGKIGYVKNIPFKCSVASGIFVVRNLIPDKLDFDYLYHLLKSSVFKEYVNKKKTDGSTINHLYQSDLEKFVIDIPDIKEQKKISKLLNHIDKKIENNKIMNKNIDKYSRLCLDKIMSNKNIKKEIIKFGDLFKSQAGYAFKSSDWKNNGDSVLTIKSLNDDILNLKNVSYINTIHEKK
jgi:type I restriction enzyme S subunit